MTCSDSLHESFRYSLTPLREYLNELFQISQRLMETISMKQRLGDKKRHQPVS
jgi:hypothetical protein